MAKKYFIITYGCQMNKNDSQRIAGFLEKSGLKQAPKPEEADLVVVNICSVRQSAVDRAFEKIRSLKSYNPEPKIIATGCITEKDKARLKKITDATIDVKKLHHLGESLSELGFKIQKAEIKDYLKVEPRYKKAPLAYVPIMTGCNNFCSFCVVPFTRGPERSRDPKEIWCEIKNWLKHGAKEVWLLGQNVNSYRWERKGKIIDFPKLLKMVNDIPGKFWIRFTSPHPKDLKDELIETMAKCKKVTPYINLPLQSGDDEILKRMNRPYTASHYKKLIKKLRAEFKKYRKGLEGKLAISTDVIVGFPGEKRKHFENTKKLLKEIGFFMAYIAQYSPRPGTAAYNLKDDVPFEEKERREKELTEVVKKTGLEFNKIFVGKTVDVLVLKKKKGFFYGKTRHYQTIKFPAEKKGLVGKFVQIKVLKAQDFGLEGKFTNEAGSRGVVKW